MNIRRLRSLEDILKSTCHRHLDHPLPPAPPSIPNSFTWSLRKNWVPLLHPAKATETLSGWSCFHFPRDIIPQYLHSIVTIISSKPYTSDFSKQWDQVFIKALKTPESMNKTARKSPMRSMLSACSMQTSIQRMRWQSSHFAGNPRLYEGSLGDLSHKEWEEKPQNPH